MASQYQDWSRASEAELIKALQAQERSAYREAMIRYGGAMLAAARSITSAQAEDAVQEAWLSAFDAIRNFEGRASLKTWLVRITINKAYNHVRSTRREVSLEGLENEHDPLANAFGPGGRFGVQWNTQFQQWTDDSPEALINAHVLQECLDHHLESLPEGQRLAITLKDIEGLSPSEICNTLSISPSNFRVLLHRARIRVFTMVSHYEETGEC